jgi:cardiolipin synthase (CMP-forming)
MTVKDLPNLATAARIALAVIVFALLAVAARLGPVAAPADLRPALIGWALGLFAIAALTDFLDGWLARRLDARSALGVMLDPIADKIAIVAAIVGLAALDAPLVAWPGALMLMRELFVAGLRESGMKLPVSQLAKWKTTVQLVALGAAMGAELVPPLKPAAVALLWLATALTLWTGLDYLRRTLASLRP